MTIDPGRYWQDSDDPDWSDEKEAAFITELSLFSIQNALRPRDADDVDVPEGTFRATVLAYHDAYDAAVAQLQATRRGRFFWRLLGLYARVRGWARP